MGNPNPFEPTGFEVDLSDYNLPPTPAPTAAEYPEGSFEPMYPFPNGQEEGSNDE